MTVTIIGRFIRRAIECYLIFYYIITIELTSTNMYILFLDVSRRNLKYMTTRSKFKCAAITHLRRAWTH